MSSTDDLVPILKKLRMSGILETLDLRSRQAIEEELSLPDFLYRLLTDEVERREAKQLGARLRRACFEHNKTLEEFDFAFNPTIPRARIIDLAAGAFVERAEVILVVGPTGTGKSHLAQAIGHRACRRGHSVLFTPAHQMLAQLRAARADQSFERKLLRYTSPNLLIIDDLGLRPLRGGEPEDLYEVIRQRYERGAMVITSNRSVKEWYPLFGDALLASAAMDRLLHHAQVVPLDGESFRNPLSSHRRSAGPVTQPAAS